MNCQNHVILYLDYSDLLLSDLKFFEETRFPSASPIVRIGLMHPLFLPDFK